MLVRTKEQVQKSFRIDKNIEKDLCVLSELTNRSQNDLANVALKELLQDNKFRFLKNVIWEHFICQIEDGEAKFEPFKMGGVEVKLTFDDNSIKIESKIGDDDFYTKKYETIESVKEDLVDLSDYIDVSSSDTIEYVNDRTDYRDYVKIR